MEDRPPSIQDVAKKAGVSTATVSRTLANPTVVAEATRNAVHEAIKNSGYVANTSAQNLRRRRTHSVLALVPNLANPFFSQILSGVSLVLSPLGYNLLVADTEGTPGAGERLLTEMNGSRADGLIIFDGSIPASVLRSETRSWPLPPTIMACEWIADAPFPRVRIDNELGAALAVTLLSDRGHTRIGHIRGPEGNVLTASREAGFRTAMAERRLEIPQSWILDGDFSFRSGAIAARRWLALDPRPSAMLCANDEMAVGFMGAVVRAGLTVPGDVSVVGFDDIELVDHVTPRLTTIRQPRRDLGMTAARKLLELIEGKQEVEEDVVLTVEAIVRDSTAAL